MKAFLIDPFAKAITQVEYSGDYRDIYKLIRCEGSPYTTVELPTGRDAIFVDDEGLFKEAQRFFTLYGYEQPLAGRGLVLGCNADGDTVAPKIALEALKRVVSWARPDLRVAGFEHSEEDIEHPMLGRTRMFKVKPHFKFEKDEER